MPKVPHSHSSAVSDDGDDKSRVNDVQARKKRNADAQAAFRQRRATYISSLEETVVSLEAVVVKLQDSCREARAEAESLRQERDRLRHEGREREKVWRALWAQRSGQGPSSPDGIPPVPDVFAQSPVVQQIPVPSTPPATAMSAAGYSNEADGNRYPVAANGANPAYFNGSYAHPQSHYVGNSAAISYSAVSNGHSTQDARNQYAVNGSAVKYNGYGPYAVAAGTQNRDPLWPQGVNSTSTPADATVSGHGPSSSQSPMHYADHSNAPSPVLTHNPRYVVDGSAGLDHGYVMDQSPTVSAPSTPVSSSSTTATTSYPFTYAEAPVGTAYERGDAGGVYARPHNGHPVGGIGLTLHGGTADISALVSTNRGAAAAAAAAAGGGGYRPNSAPAKQPGGGATRPDSMSMMPLIPSLPSTHATKSSPVLERGRTATREPTSSSRSPDSPSRSPSPAHDSPISGTLAVIKAQAFGTTRRNARTRTKKSATHARIAIEALEARGSTLGLSPTQMTRKPIKRQRLESDDEGAPL